MKDHERNLVKALVATMRAEARAARDAELAESEVRPLALSEVKRRQKRASLVVLPVLALWIASWFGVIALVRPSERSGWYMVLIFGYFIVSMAVFLAIKMFIYDRFGVRCPYCGATIDYVELTGKYKPDPEDQRRCATCNAVMIDLAS